MAARINVLKIAFSTAALALLIGALVVSDTSRAADRVFVPGRVYAVTGGKTTLKVSDRMIKKLKRAKVTVKPTGSAKGGLRKLTFPITGGRVGVSEGKPVGVVKHRGSGFRMGKSTPKLFEFKSPTINLGTGIMAFQGPFGSPNLGKLFKSCFTFKEWVKPCPSHVVKLTRPGARLLRSLGLKVKPGAKFGFIQIPRIGEEVIVD